MLVLWIGLAVVAVAVAAIGLNMFGRYSGLTVPAKPPETVAELLEPYLIERRPQGPGPFPTALLFSGCDGVRDNLTTLSAALLAKGWASIIVDSHTPRGFTELQRWRLICTGQLFQGSERAGDVAAAVSIAKQRDYVDGNRLALMGASHGGWAVLEYLSMADHGKVPTTLQSWPEALHTNPLAGVRAVVLFYPYCGQLSRASRRGWTSAIPTLFLLAKDDAIANENDCIALAKHEAHKDLPIETVVYSNVTHGFDQEEKAPLSALSYNAQVADHTVARAVDFVEAAALAE